MATAVFPAGARTGTATAAAARRVALIGNPNTGKTTLFNALCGVRAKTSNFPGTTTAVRTGRSEGVGAALDVLDLPGVYDLDVDTPESAIARDVLDGGSGPPPDAVVVIVDACNLARNLVLVGQLLAHQPRVVVALNMIDLAARRGLTIDSAALSRRLGVPVVPTVARSGQGLDLVRQAVLAPPPALAGAPPVDAASVEALAAWANDAAGAVTGGEDAHQADGPTERLDAVLTHPVWGLAAFVAIMGALFWILFALATVPMDLIEATFAELGTVVDGTFPAGPVRDLVSQGIVGGIAGTVVFLPQICLLFFLITLLEDTGYLARAAFVMDRHLSRFGLPGHAFVPLLTSHACALPGIMSTRLIPDRRDRLATILVAPFMSCSARLPVYVLLTTLLFADRPGLAGLAFAGCYLLGAVAALVTAKLFGSTILKGRARPMILELPSYKTPSLTNALLTAKDQGVSFLTTAGTVIVAICIVMWWLSAYPHVAPPARALELRAAATAAGVTAAQADALGAEADALEAKAAQAGSFAGR
ncbi:MAG: ferrous iron transporter B, partial [Vicinamibacterales bacterium]